LCFKKGRIGGFGLQDRTWAKGGGKKAPRKGLKTAWKKGIDAKRGL